MTRMVFTSPPFIPIFIGRACPCLSRYFIGKLVTGGLGRYLELTMQRTDLPNMFYNAKRSIFQNACELRENMTDAEKHLWARLNKNQLGVRFKAQHPIDIFIVDFYCHQFKLVVEVDGEIHLSQKDYDDGRTAELERFGLKVIRFTNQEILNNVDMVVDEIKKHLTSGDQ